MISSGRLPAWGRDHLDPLLAAAIATALELECWLDSGFAGARPLTAVAIAFFAAPLAWRRRSAIGALAFSSCVMTIQALLGGMLQASSGVGVLLALALLSYSIGASVDGPRGMLGLALGGLLFGGFAAQSAADAAGAAGTELFTICAALLAPWLIGRVSRGRAGRAAAFSDLAAQVTAEREERRLAAIAEERTRIGRELQDIIAHSVSAMVIQSAGARRTLRSDRQEARESILAVERTGREALSDLRRLLGMLRKDDDPRALTPQPGLSRLSALLARVAETGLACELVCEGEPIDLTPGIDLVSYRVIEAALTSALRQKATWALVTVRYHASQLELEIRGEGTVGDPASEAASLNERVALYDGILCSLAPEKGAFAWRAQLPLETELAR